MANDAPSGSFDSALMTLVANEFCRRYTQDDRPYLHICRRLSDVLVEVLQILAHTHHEFEPVCGRERGVAERESAEPGLSEVEGRNPERVARRIPKKLSNVLVERLQILADSHHELVGVSPIDDAMVVSQHQADNVAHGDRIVAVLIGYDDRLLEDAAHAQDGHLRLQDDRGAKLRSEDSRIGDGDGAALNFIGHKFFGAGTLAQIADGALQAHKAEVLRALDYGHDQAPLQSHR